MVSSFKSRKETLDASIHEASPDTILSWICSFVMLLFLRFADIFKLGLKPLRWICVHVIEVFNPIGSLMKISWIFLKRTCAFFREFFNILLEKVSKPLRKLLTACSNAVLHMYSIIAKLIMQFTAPARNVAQSILSRTSELMGKCSSVIRAVLSSCKEPIFLVVSWLNPILKNIFTLIRAALASCKEYIFRVVSRLTPIVKNIYRLIHIAQNFGREMISSGWTRLVPAVTKLTLLITDFFFFPVHKYVLKPILSVVRSIFCFLAPRFERFITFVAHQRLLYKRRTRKGVNVNDFTLNVPQGSLVSRKRGHFVMMPNKTVYSLSLGNDNPFHANCTITIDGKQVGKFRMAPASSYTIERPTNHHARFCFIQENTTLAPGAVDAKTGVTTGGKMNGLIEAQFVPCFLACDYPHPIQRPQERKFLPAFETKEIVSGLDVKLQIWDTAGQERFHSITSNYYRGANAVCIFFATDDASSLSETQKWLEEVRRFVEPSCLLLLVGNKLDLSLPDAKAQNLAQQENLTFLTCSAKTGEGVDELFQYIADHAEKYVSAGHSEVHLKVVLIGSPGVGKTSVHNRYTRRTFSTNYVCTIGADFATKIVVAKNAELRILPEEEPLSPGVFQEQRRQRSTGGLPSGCTRVAGVGATGRESPRETKMLATLSNKLKAAPNRRRHVAPVHSAQQSIGGDEECDDTATGATSFRGRSHQSFRNAPRMVEDASRAVTLRLTTLLSRQYEHQIMLEKVLNQTAIPQCSINIIGEYIYTQSILDTY
jgi:small GTP-binding protein